MFQPQLKPSALAVIDSAKIPVSDALTGLSTEDLEQIQEYALVAKDDVLLYLTDIEINHRAGWVVKHG